MKITDHPEEGNGRISGDGFFNDLIEGVRQGKIKIVNRETVGTRIDGTQLVKLELEVME